MGWFSHLPTVIKGYASNWSAQSDSYYYFYYIIFGKNQYDEWVSVREFPANGNPYQQFFYNYRDLYDKLFYMAGYTGINGEDGFLFADLPSNKPYKIMIFFGDVEPRYDADENIIDYYWTYQTGNGMEYTAYVTLRDYMPFYSKFPDSSSVVTFTSSQSWTVPAFDSMTVELWGGGGSGSIAYHAYWASEGGQGGSYKKYTILPGQLTVGSTQTVIVGSGGPGNNVGSSYGPGLSGSYSAFGDAIWAAGGRGGDGEWNSIPPGVYLTPSIRPTAFSPTVSVPWTLVAEETGGAGGLAPNSSTTNQAAGKGQNRTYAGAGGGSGINTGGVYFDGGISDNGGAGGRGGNGSNVLAGSQPGGGGGGGIYTQITGAGANGKVVITYSGATGPYISMLDVAQAYPFLSTVTYQTGNPGTVYMEWLIVAGGGGGGATGSYGGGGGGGAGGVVTGDGLISFANFTIIVGGSGSGSTGTTGGNGGDSTAFGITAIGGGGGGGGGYGGANYLGANGGSGGGGRGYSTGGGAGGGSGVYGQGNMGGTGFTYPGGGGGAGGRGGDGAGGDAHYGDSSGVGAGGPGLISSISGANLTYATGARGSYYTEIGIAGSPNTGNGGTGGGGGDGGSGIVIIRYQGNQKYSGGDVSSSNGYTVHTFRSSGQFNALPDYTPLYATYIDINNSYLRAALEKKGSGTAITLNDAHGKTVFNIADMVVGVPESGIFMGCGGVGYGPPMDSRSGTDGVYLRIRKQDGFWMYMPRISNDYYTLDYQNWAQDIIGYDYDHMIGSGKSERPTPIYGPPYVSSYNWNPWCYIGPYSALALNSNGRFAINDRTEYTFPSYAKPWAYGRDHVTLRVTIQIGDIVRWLGSGWCPIYVVIDRDCKGGSGGGSATDGDGIAFYYNGVREIAATAYLNIDL
jgi:hypothetical protein